jgi:hypothetical protein
MDRGITLTHLMIHYTDGSKGSLDLTQSSPHRRQKLLREWSEQSHVTSAYLYKGN